MSVTLDNIDAMQLENEVKEQSWLNVSHHSNNNMLDRTMGRTPLNQSIDNQEPNFNPAISEKKRRRKKRPELIIQPTQPKQS